MNIIVTMFRILYNSLCVGALLVFGPAAVCLAQGGTKGGDASQTFTQKKTPSIIEIWNSATLHERIIEQKSDTTYVLNFWATWCKPCVEELPSFVKLDSSFKARGLKARVILLSLDFRKDYETKLSSFLMKRNIQSQVVLFSDADMNDAIDRVSKDWSGALPATLVVNTEKHQRVFYEQSFSEQELFKAVYSLIGE